MNDTKPGSTVVEPFARFTPAEAARNKKVRDARRKSIRGQNLRSKSVK